jgi:hypothetical protein
MKHALYDPEDLLFDQGRSHLREGIFSLLAGQS